MPEAFHKVGGMRYGVFAHDWRRAGSPAGWSWWPAASSTPARALERTYLRPAPTQERAAEPLGLPFSIYRRHLSRGVERVVDRLSQRELFGATEQDLTWKVSTHAADSARHDRTRSGDLGEHGRPYGGPRARGHLRPRHADRVAGHRPARMRLANRYSARLQAVAEHDVTVASAFLDVIAMLRPPQTLMRPSVVRWVVTA